MTVTLIDHNRENEREFETRAQAEEKKNDMVSLGAKPEDLEIVNGVEPEVIKHSEDGETATEPIEKTDGGTQAEPKPQTQTDIDALVENPIEWLRGINSEYVNVVKGTPAISKRGFRYIQSKFEISTESEVVQWVNEPTGVIVWAKAELPDGRSAEAHGEGWQFESKVDDNEFVRYADTRAKNRALADLTSSGALATEELK